ncbi:homoserine dehydrogenase [Lactobacillus amylovorus]|uniref:homoserine dehydrogenase n=1 Tax=Lactobacillus amylovorus TaxID=1604 RepID=UPI00232C4DA2|nr:homoserine dehydrogenase [Lactobacillus amylovorus]MDB6243981.1 homoserine dehydrogenase [Lactobacillus amylovorus]MDB6248176.1 homoserine dehydrogenase [Lactobacillus amylovorus]MDB6259718.1 homoserine dehydrogenase [Lactobacillus amylovorus]MDB6263595.1 homoserine dehydrogenase [Lactobacillus amylovorus]
MAIKIALLGLGTVGSGVLKIIKNNQKKIKQTSGEEIVIKKALVRNLKKHQNVAKEVELTTNYDDILHDAEIKIVVELMGGLHPAKEYISEALNAGKNVVTANKGLMATFGSELIALAAKNKCDLMYDASVAGGIPILRTLSTSYASDKISEIQGIINGTTNYILSQMGEKGLSYDEALKSAQELGFAEADPTNDVTGKDAAYKIVILSKFAFGTKISINDFTIEGINHLQKFDIEQAQTMGYVIKLIGIAKNIAGKLFIEVAPCLLPNNSIMSHIKDEINALQIKSQSLGTAIFTGPGAGSLATANSVMSDVIAETSNFVKKTNGQPFSNFSRTMKLTSSEEVKYPYYLSFETEETLLDLSELFSKLEIPVKEIKHVDEKTIVVTEEISRRQLQDLAIQDKYLRASYKIL